MLILKIFATDALSFFSSFTKSSTFYCCSSFCAAVEEHCDLIAHFFSSSLLPLTLPLVLPSLLVLVRVCNCLSTWPFYYLTRTSTSTTPCHVFWLPGAEANKIKNTGADATSTTLYSTPELATPSCRYKVVKRSKAEPLSRESKLFE